MSRTITIDDLYAMNFVSRPRMSPGGKQIAYVVATVDVQKHLYHSSIWITSLETGEARRFTWGPANAHSPSWSPDGRWLAFVSDREGEVSAFSPSERKERGVGKPQIWVLPTDGGEAHQVTWRQHGAASPLWSPDGKRILFNAEVRPADEEDSEGKALPKVRVIDHVRYRFDGVGFTYERRSHLFVVDVASGEPVQVTDGDCDNGDAAWSPDGSQIVFVSDRREERWIWPVGDLYLYSFQSESSSPVRRLTDSSLWCSSPSWSPDGKTIAFVAAPVHYDSGYTRLYTIPSNASELAPTCLSADTLYSCSDWTNSDVGDEHLVPTPIWSPDGTSLTILASLRGASRVFVLSTTGDNTEPLIITPENLHVRDVSSDAGRKTLALLVADATHVQEVFMLSPTGDGELQKVSSLNDALWKDLQLVEPEPIRYTGADGWQIEGWIMKPHDFVAKNKYPLVTEIHGGPNTQYGYGFFHEMQILVAQGYVVFYCNPRGSIGYGYEFADAVRGAWGKKDSVDIQLGIDAVIKQGYIDEQRLAVTGGSYGGFMTNWLVSHSDRFKVAITDRCVANLATMFGVSDIGWDLAYENVEKNPWENLEAFMEMSPIKYVQNIHTPLLIIHSEQDLRCNIEQAEQLFAALKYLGREVRFIRFEGQSHGLSRGGNPHSRVLRLKHIVDWFAHYLQ